MFFLLFSPLLYVAQQEAGPSLVVLLLARPSGRAEMELSTEIVVVSFCLSITPELAELDGGFCYFWSSLEMERITGLWNVRVRARMETRAS